MLIVKGGVVKVCVVPVSAALELEENHRPKELINSTTLLLKCGQRCEVLNMKMLKAKQSKVLLVVSSTKVHSQCYRLNDDCILRVYMFRESNNC